MVIASIPVIVILIETEIMLLVATEIEPKKIEIGTETSVETLGSMAPANTETRANFLTIKEWVVNCSLICLLDESHVILC